MSIIMYETIAGFCIQTRWQAVPLSAQDLRDIYDWCLLHMPEIEAKAEADILKQQQQQMLNMVEPEPEPAAGE